MANADTPQGLSWVANVNGQKTPPVVYYDVHEETTIYRGTICKLDGTGYAVPITATGLANDNTYIIGVSEKYIDGSSTDPVVNCPFVSAHGTIFKVQTDAELAATRAAFMTILDSGSEYAVNLGTSGTAATGRSTSELDVGATSGILVVVGWEDRPDNTWGTHQDVYVRISTADMVAAPEFVTE